MAPVDRNFKLHGVLVEPGRSVLQALARLHEAGSLRAEIDEMLDLEEAPRAHERVESGRGQGKVILRLRDRRATPATATLTSRKRP